MEDSFDDPVPMSKSDELEQNEHLEEEEEEKSLVEDEEEEDEQEDEEEEEKEVEELNLNDEDFNLLTIETVSMKTLTTRCARVISEIMIRGESGAIALFEVANKLVFQSTMLEEEHNSVLQLIIEGLTRIYLDSRERHESAEVGERYLSLLLAKIAVKNRSMKSEDLLTQLIIFIDRLYFHVDSFVRCRIYKLIAMLIKEENQYMEAIKEQGDMQFLFTDEELEEPETIVPLGTKYRWMEKLTRSLMDKAPTARSAAIQALALWDQSTVVKRCDELTVNDLIWKSLHDVDESARLTAARHLDITSETAIDKCMNFVETSKDSKVRQAIMRRLATDVHLLSFSMEQRFRFINLLSNSESIRVKDVLHDRLVPSWMTAAGEESNYLEIFGVPKPEDNFPKEFPSIILQFLDPQIDPKAVHIFLKFATLRFIKSTSGESLEQFMKNLLELTDSERENLGILKRIGFRLVCDEPENLKKTFFRIFLTRCFLDVIFECSASRVDFLSLRNRALMFFTPDIVNFARQLEEFCSFYFASEDTEEHQKFKFSILSNLLHILNLAIKHGNADFDREVYQDALKRILGAPELQIPLEIVEILVLTVLDLEQNDENREKQCEWISEKAKVLLMVEVEGSDHQNLENAMKMGVVTDRMYLRAATMLLATCKHEKIRAPTSGMSSLFVAMIPALLGSSEKQIQNIGLELIGRAASIDFENCGAYLKLTRFLIQRDDVVLQSTGLGTLIKVIKAKGFPDTADAIFGDADGETLSDEDEELLAHLIEKTVVALDGEALGHAVVNCFSMLSHGNFAWPKLMSVLLLITFQKRNAHLQLPKVFQMYCKYSVKSLKRKICVLTGFIKAIQSISKIAEADANCDVLGMAAAVCEAVSRVPIVGEDDEKTGEICVESELIKRALRRAVAHPSGWIIRHVFNAFSNHLRLECVPTEVLRNLHDQLVDGYTLIRFNSTSVTQNAVKRFLTHCEKAISLQSKVKGLEMTFDLRKVKEEEVEPSSASSARSKSSSKRSWDHGDSFSEDSDDSFDYFPLSTRTRKRPATSTPKSSPKKSCSRMEELQIDDDDSFEL